MLPFTDAAARSINSLTALLGAHGGGCIPRLRRPRRGLLLGDPSQDCALASAQRCSKAKEGKRLRFCEVVDLPALFRVAVDKIGDLVGTIEDIGGKGCVGHVSVSMNAGCPLRNMPSLNIVL